MTAPRVAAPPSARHLASLDGVRGLAILLVVLYHCQQVLPLAATRVGGLLGAVTGAGWSGVDLFFVLSGFLITGILLDARGDGPATPPGYFSAFYARRALRIFPLYYAYLLVVVLIAPPAPEPHSPLWHWLYGSNLLVARYGWGAITRGWTGALWSLSVEEQFYLVWPALVLWAGRRRMPAVCGAIVVAALAGRVLAMRDVGPHAAYTLMPLRADALAVGAWIATVWRRPDGEARLARLSPWLLGAGGLVVGGLAIRFRGLPYAAPLVATLGYSALAVGYGGVVARAATSAPSTWFARAFQTPPLRVLGRYSYAIYLFHGPLLRPIARMLAPGASEGSGRQFFAYAAVLLLVTTALAALSWHWFEGPLNRLKSRAPMPRPV
ncbi:MAG TPA: acyltransferase [Gemmatirosa sp.]